MSVSISSGGGGGITVESDPTALKIANNLSDITDGSAARSNIGALPIAGGTVTGPLAVSSGLNQAIQMQTDDGSGTASLNVTDSITSNQVNIYPTAIVASNPSGAIIISASTGIKFADNSYQTTAAGASFNIQTFGTSTTSGNFTWIKPAGAKWVEIWLWGGAGGGGSGARQATTSARTGGAGGAGGRLLYAQIAANALNPTETVSIGAGGAGGAAVTVNSTNGNAGQLGGNTTFASWRSVSAIAVAQGGNSSLGPGGISSGSSLFLANIINGGGSGAGTTNAGSSGNTNINYPYLPGGGGGGGGNLANQVFAQSGGTGGASVPQTSPSIGPGLNVTIAGGAGGTTAGVQATAGTSNFFNLTYGGTGGGGGFYLTNQNGGNGAAGGFPGGGGGGGGASDNGFNSGAGGVGANGYAVIITHI